MKTACSQCGPKTGSLDLLSERTGPCFIIFLITYLNLFKLSNKNVIACVALTHGRNLALIVLRPENVKIEAAACWYLRGAWTMIWPRCVVA